MHLWTRHISLNFFPVVFQYAAAGSRTT